MRRKISTPAGRGKLAGYCSSVGNDRGRPSREATKCSPDSSPKSRSKIVGGGIKRATAGSRSTGRTSSFKYRRAFFSAAKRTGRELGSEGEKAERAIPAKNPLGLEEPARRLHGTVLDIDRSIATDRDRKTGGARPLRLADVSIFLLRCRPRAFARASGRASATADCVSPFPSSRRCMTFPGREPSFSLASASSSEIICGQPLVWGRIGKCRGRRRRIGARSVEAEQAVTLQ